MGKKGSWISAIKKAFSSNSKDKPAIVHVEKKDTREKKWAFGNTKKPEINSLIPIYREPSSVEKILGDAERETGTDHEPYRTQPYQSPRNRRRFVEQEQDRYRNGSYQSSSKNRRSVEQEIERYHTNTNQPDINNRRSVENEKDRYHTEVYQSSSNNRRSSVELERNKNCNKDQQVNASRINGVIDHNVELQNNFSQKSPKIQLDPKWVHPPRRKIKRTVAHASALKIQTAFRGYLARRNYRALKGLIRLQIMMRGESVKYQTINTMKQMQTLVKVQSQIRARRLEMMENRDYNAIKVNTKDTDTFFGLWNTQTNTRGEGSWNESVLTKEEAERRMRLKLEAVMKRERALAYAYSHQLLKTGQVTASAILADLHSGTSQWYWNPVPDEPNPNRYQTNLKPKLKLPIQTQSDPPISSKPKLKLPIQTQFDSPISSNPKFKSKSKPNPNFSVKDDESLTSCPPFSVPNYMAQTVSAKAKIKSRALEKQNEKKKFNLGQSIFGKGYFWKDLGQSEKETGRRIKHRSSLSVGSGFSIDSAVSMPVVVGRRPFK